MADSAQFNYRLRRLTGQFVAETGDGYEFRSPGRAVIRAAPSGSPNRSPELEPFAVEGDCIDCGAGLEALCGDERLRVVYPDRGRRHADRGVRPAGGRTPGAVVAEPARPVPPER